MKLKDYPHILMELFEAVAWKFVRKTRLQKCISQRLFVLSLIIIWSLANLVLDFSPDVIHHWVPFNELNHNWSFPWKLMLHHRWCKSNRDGCSCFLCLPFSDKFVKDEGNVLLSRVKKRVDRDVLWWWNWLIPITLDDCHCQSWPEVLLKLFIISIFRPQVFMYIGENNYRLWCPFHFSGNKI